MFRYLGGEFLFWMLLGWERRKFHFYMERASQSEYEPYACVRNIALNAFRHITGKSRKFTPILGRWVILYMLYARI